MGYLLLGLILLWTVIAVTAQGSQPKLRLTQQKANCSAMHYGPGCQRCKCTLDGSVSCDVDTGKCQCKAGFTGPTCIDIDECVGPAGDVHCPDKFTYCENTRGSFQCPCKSGYTQGASGKCYPCSGGKKGRNCARNCDCEKDNSVSCLSETGTCICKRGWEGSGCRKSVNDCARKPCKNLKCVDTHQGHVCVCEHGKRYVRGQCRDFSVQLYVLEENTVFGELINVYILYSLSHPYVVNPLQNPDFSYKILINGNFVCKISFHATHMRIRGREYILEKLKTNRNHHFYSHFQMRRSDPALVIIKAEPDSKEYYEITKVMDATKGQHVQTCLSNMEITGTAQCNQHNFDCIWKRASEKLRQNYNTFKVNLNASGTCQTSYQYSWTYMRVSGSGKPHTCPKFQEIDMTDLVFKSGEPSITDHNGEVVVIPKNTLPLGRMIICVNVYVKDSVKRVAVACGVIEVKPSDSLVGYVKPHAGGKQNFFSYCTRKQTFPMRAEFWVPDANIPVRYHWRYLSITHYHHASHLYFIRRFAINKYKGRTLFLIFVFCSSFLLWMFLIVISRAKQVSFYCGTPQRMVVRLWVYAGRKQKHFEWVYFSKDFTFPFRCHVSCDYIVGSDQTLAITLYPTGPTSGNWDLSGIKTTYLQKKQGEFIVLQPTTGSRPHKYTLLYKDGSKGLTTYYIKVPEQPSGSGCSINPNSGKAVFTLFKITCRNYKFRGQEVHLRYHLFRKDLLIGGNDILNLVAYGGSQAMSDITFASAQESGTETVELTLKIISFLNSHVEHHFTVQLAIDDQKETLNTTMPKITDPYLKINRQENVRFITDVANVIFPNGTASKERRTQVRNQLLKALGNYKDKTAEWVMHTAAALEKITGQEDELKPDGVSAGITVLSQLCEYLPRVGTTNILTTQKVNSVLLHAVDRLIYKVSTYGTDVVRGRAIGSKQVLLSQSKTDGKKGVESIIKITDAMFRTLIGHNKKEIITLKHIEIGVETRYIDRTGNFQFDTQDIQFYLPAPSLGLNQQKEFVDGAYHVYKKNPYSFASEHMHGDLPLIYVDFARMGSTGRDFKVPRSKTVKASKLFRFIRPADVILKFNSPAAEKKTYLVTIDVEQRKDEQVVTKSSCLFISVPISPNDTTALMIRSQDNLIIKVIMSYTNEVKKLKDTGNGTAVQLPLYGSSTKVHGRTLTRDPYTIFLPPKTKTGKKLDILYYRLSISIKTGTSVNTTKLKIAPKQGRIRGSDSAQDYITAYLTNITVTPFKMSCKHYDTVVDKFSSKKCFMTEFSNLKHLHCRCIVAGAYTGSVQSLSSLIYQLNMGIFFDQIYMNPLAPTLLTATWMIVIAMMFWAKLHDRRDEESCKVTVLADNADHHTYIYLIGVITGKSTNARTTSNVYIYLDGSWGRSSVHHLYDRTKSLFQSGAKNWFILTTSDDIGDIHSVVLWTDFSGAYPSWFLQNVIVENLQTNESWIFQYNSWLSIARGSGKLVIEIPAYQEQAESTTWAKQALEMAKTDILNDLFWIGLVSKSPTDKFTRVRRLATGLTVLQTLMLVNLMIYRIARIDVTSEQRPHVIFMEQKIHLSSIWISLESASVMTLVGIFLGFIFSSTKDKPAPKHRTQFTETQKDMVMRQDGMEARKKQGLSMYIPLFSSYKTATPEDAEEPFDPDVEETLGHQEGEMEGEAEKEEEPEEQEPLIKEEQEDNPEIKQEKQKVEKIQQDFENLKQEMVARGKPSSRTFMLWWWSIYLTWTMVLILNGMLAYYIVMHGLRLKYEESLEWLLAFFMGIFFNAFLLVPFIVLVKAAVKVLICKKKQRQREEEPISHLAQGMKILFKYRIGRHTYDSYKQKRNKTHPPNISRWYAKLVLERLKVESEAREMIRDLILYSIFMATILIIIHGHLNAYEDHEQKVGVENELLGFNNTNSVGGDDDEDSDVLAEIRTRDDMWDYLSETVAVRLIPGIDDMNNDLSRNFMIMGYARLRQVRSIKNQSSTDCHESIPRVVWPRHIDHSCIDSVYGDLDEEKHTFYGNWGTTWSQPNVNPTQDSVYRYYTANELKAHLFFGELGIYSGGGYVQHFVREDPGAVQLVLRQLQFSNWIDRFTRCIFLEFTVYNPHLEMFTQVTIAFEFNVFGGVLASKNINTANISLEDKRSSRWFKLVQMLYFVCLVISIMRNINRVQREGPRVFFSNLWNWLEMVMIVLTLLCILFYVMSRSSFLRVMEDFRVYKHNFYLDFDTVFYWENLFHVTMGLAGSIAILKMIRVTKFNPFWKTFSRCIAIGWGDFKAFMLVTMLIVLAYCCFGVLVFGRQAKVYSSFGRSMFSLLSFILGEPDFETIVGVDLVFGRIFFLTFMFISQYFIVFMLIAILRDALDIARYMDYTHENAVVRYIANTVLLYLNAISPQLHVNSN